MAGTLVFDTTFLIDFQRERRREGSYGPAHRFLVDNRETSMQLPVTALGEFAEGFADPADPVLRATADQFEVLPVDARTAYHYADITRRLRADGCLIGTNDLWIAACALRHGHGLVTRNTGELRRVPGLRVVGY